jgi:hypothetical protein
VMAALNPSQCRAATSSARDIIFQIPIPAPHHLKKEPHDGIHHAALK